MRLVNHCHAAAVLLQMSVFTVALAQTPQPGITAWSGTSGSGVVSPVVVATWITHDESSGLKLLDLLVLWRGTPGWFTKAQASSCRAVKREARL